ncbi:hypothetical protein HMPREF0023_2252, partial [Acinetobacter sp. ATCC 27244]
KKIAFEKYALKDIKHIGANKTTARTIDVGTERCLPSKLMTSIFKSCFATVFPAFK